MAALAEFNEIQVEFMHTVIKQKAIFFVASINIKSHFKMKKSKALLNNTL